MHFCFPFVCFFCRLNLTQPSLIRTYFLLNLQLDLRIPMCDPTSASIFPCHILLLWTLSRSSRAKQMSIGDLFFLFNNLVAILSILVSILLRFFIILPLFYLSLYRKCMNSTEFVLFVRRYACKEGDESR